MIMKKQIFNIGVVALFMAGSLGFAGCGGNGGDQKGDKNNGGKKQEKKETGKKGKKKDGHDHKHDGDGHKHDTTSMKKQNKSGEGNGQKSAYICPMECEGSGAAESGKCPECGMDLVKRSELDKKKKQKAS